jgi:hypothetical protein
MLLGRISDPLQASLEGSHLPVTPLRNRSPITPSPLCFQLVTKYLFMVDVDWRILRPEGRSPAGGVMRAGAAQLMSKDHKPYRVVPSNH